MSRVSNVDQIEVLVQIQDLLRTILHSAGYEVQLTPSGKKGMKNCESKHLGLGITDVVVPDLD
ncbi:MAG: hypothetical protein ABSF90_17670 [Syntrophobacteraceae bacterium]|jgi:DNA-binding response OmpR family regulator